MKPALRRWLVVGCATVAAAACSRDTRTPLVVYSPHGKDLLQYYEQAFEKAHPDVDVQWVDMGSQDILDRVRSEKANPQADVWFGAPAESFARAAGEGLLAPYKPTWAAAAPADAHDANDLWYGTYLTPEVIAYNNVAVKEGDAPQDWDDVLDPKWKGKVVIRDPVSSGSMRAIFGAIIARSIRQTGSEQQGWDWLRRLDGQTREYVLNPTILYQKLGRQEGVISLWDMPDIATLQQATKIPVSYVIPRSGTPLLVDGIAIVKGSRHPELAREFYEFVTTPQALQDAAAKFLRIPVRTDLNADALPGWIRDARARIAPMPVDQKMLLDSLDTWMKFWDANIRNSQRGK
ncbi:MAG TPA: extracellular solute-binding protein [Gemmatimonadaceae bacterium]|nr:extracellular solute-binding protein [Gemmatimonadaceae bacterium]